MLFVDQTPLLLGFSECSFRRGRMWRRRLDRAAAGRAAASTQENGKGEFFGVEFVFPPADAMLQGKVSIQPLELSAGAMSPNPLPTATSRTATMTHAPAGLGLFCSHFRANSLTARAVLFPEQTT
jgi:hypothetical protein